MVRPDDVGVEVRSGTVVLHDETVGTVDGDPDHKQDYDAVVLTQTGLRRWCFKSPAKFEFGLAVR
jgi:hypothetical protein